MTKEELDKILSFEQSLNDADLKVYLLAQTAERERSYNTGWEEGFRDGRRYINPYYSHDHE